MSRLPTVLSIAAVFAAFSCGQGGDVTTGQSQAATGGSSAAGQGGSQMATGGQAGGAGVGGALGGGSGGETAGTAGSGGDPGMSVVLPDGPTCTDRPVTVMGGCGEDESCEMCLMGYAQTVTEPCGKCSCAEAEVTLDANGCVINVVVIPSVEVSTPIVKCLLDHASTERWCGTGAVETVRVQLGGCHVC